MKIEIRPDPSSVCGAVLQEMFRSQEAHDQDDKSVAIHSAISLQSCARIQELVLGLAPRHSLEIGCAMGVSTLAILYALEKQNSGHHTAIDPNQTATGPHCWDGIGSTMIHEAALDHRFTLIEKPSHLALPELLSQGARFDLIFIDGWHSFDYAFVDCFYCDLLLNEGGILIFDDWRMPPVHHVCWFLESHKKYSGITPQPLRHPLNPWNRFRERIKSNNADLEWGSIRAYRKVSDTTVRSGFFECAFYPYFRIYRYWMRLRGLRVNSPFLPGAVSLTPSDSYWPARSAAARESSADTSSKPLRP